MSSIKSLLNKQKEVQKESSNEQEIKHQETSKIKTAKPKFNFGRNNEIEKSVSSKVADSSNNANVETPATKKSKPKLNFGRKTGNSMASNPSKSTDEEKQSELHTEKSDDSPFDGLADSLNDLSLGDDLSVENILSENTDTPQKTSQKDDAQNQNQVTSLQQNTANPPTLDDLSKFVFEEQPDESQEEIALKFSEMLENVVNATGTDIPEQLAKTLQFMKEHPFLAETLKPEHIGTLVKTLGKSYGFVVKNQTEKSAKKQKKKEEQNVILNSLEGLKI